MADRFDHMPRPGLHAQSSNSVPSTPFQRPRDLTRRFSRSPSPNRGLSNQSPRSVASEAVGNKATLHRGAPVICKFESGQEYRKRRMPYNEGGDQELRPPKKEPKRTLTPNEQDKLSGDMRELYDRLLPSQESEDRRARLIEKLDRILNEEWPDSDIHVNVFGSSGNLLSSTDSDVDICITTPLKKLESMHSLAALLDKNGMEKVVCRAAAKVPIVKCWDPELELAMDLNVNNPLALQNTRMIRTYVQLDDRVRPLAKIIKYWTKRRILNDAAFGGTISSYTWICMIISFLQRREPPILPSLQKMDGHRRKSESGETSSFADDVESLKGSGAANKESLGELLFQFFRHYGYEFEYSKHVVSIREGRLVLRKEKGWDPTDYGDKESHNRLCVEEPFTTVRNLGNSADYYAWHGIHLEIRRAFELLEDGLQLERCCEQYEFPPEEKPIFQRPPPKPKPTLTRSASQSGQSNREQGSGSRRKNNNRNQSAQRPGGRRASSGAYFSNLNRSLPFSPPMGGNNGDYFQMKGSLHEQLFQQYQFLQAQQDALRAQLTHQQAQQHAQAQARVGDLAVSQGSPRPRPYLNGVPSPRMMDNAPQTAPLLPGYLYHYPGRMHPPPSPMSQARSRESGGTSTNPSSPSLVAAVPALRRQAHRASVPDGAANSVRSQSQPGRTLPHPLAMQQQAHPGYDPSGALGPQYQVPRSVSQMHPQAHQAMQYPYPHLSAAHANGHGIDPALPKEYVGYYVQSPQLGPQFATAPQMPPPPMQLRDPPSRQRRVTPDLMPPMMNGRHTSRSPSPLGHLRSFSTTADRRASQPTVIQSPPGVDPNCMNPPAPATPAETDIGGPIIVNGSNRGPAPKPTEKANGVHTQGQQLQNEVPQPLQLDENARSKPLPLRTDFAPTTPDGARRSSSPRLSPTSQPKPDRHVLSPNGTMNGDHYHESTPITSAAPLLSPVAELRTPSPTHQRGFDPQQDSPEANGGLVKAAKIANAKQAARQLGENQNPVPRTDSRHERRGSAPIPTASKPAQPIKSSTLQAPGPLANSNSQTSWQQVPKKGHKKNKSTTGAKSSNGSGGQPMPANEAERKGG
ncbi:hypothetical protein M409DRAFT_56485 [Zasmidium cellare ATCC 36951]|uniref:polynucleotide adenylyltransferase n=1 Tax=Zasmidium cellare ATCC 36951 TaxID=1080233 RepID=A0A6A6CFH1_ZASCE|nr:uncharacterized protein M409DRAFT_56485 [Zasmidium cellare ATCC 36951]KAF2164672.1 hypothetical protein M409DRAFT_56485 [Zasmidium cellare ATCC 36951]